MFMILKRKQMIIAALVFMLGIAGYLNYRYDKESIVEIASNPELREPDIGESVMVSGENVVDKDKTKAKEESIKEEPFANEKLSRDKIRAKSREELEKMLSDETLTAEVRADGEKRLNDIIFFEENERTAENMLAAKGYTAMVYMTGESVNVTVKNNAISKTDTARIADVIYELTQNNNIKIVEVD